MPPVVSHPASGEAQTLAFGLLDLAEFAELATGRVGVSVAGTVWSLSGGLTGSTRDVSRDMSSRALSRRQARAGK